MTSLDDVVRRSPVCGGLSPEDCAALVRLMDREQFAAGETIVREGEVDPALRIVLRGRCEVVKGENGKPGARLAELTAGNVCGEMSFLKPLAHSATIRALEPVEIARLAPAAFATLREQNLRAACAIIANLVELLSERLRLLDSRVTQLVQESEHRQDEWEDFRHRLFASGEFM
jgi:CRP-like cAMP-binding protein